MADNIPNIPQVVIPEIQVDIPEINIPQIDFSQPARPIQSDPHTFSSGFGSGVDQMQAGLYASAEAFGEKFGFNDLADWGQEGRLRNLQETSRYGEGVQFGDWDTTQDFFDYTARKAGELLPELLGQAATAIGGTAMALGNPMGGVALNAAYNLSSNVGQAQVLSKSLKGEGGEITGAELLTAAGLTAADVFLVGKFTSPFMKSTVAKSVEVHGKEKTKEAIEASLKKAGAKPQVAQEIAGGVVQAAAVNAASTGLQEIVAYDAANQEIPEGQLTRDMIESATLGGLLGGGLGSVGTYVKNKAVNDFFLNDGGKAFEAQFKPEGKQWWAWNKITGRPLDSQVGVAGMVDSGRKLIGMFRNIGDAKDLHSNQKLKANRYMNAYQNMARDAESVYGKKNKHKVLEDYQNGIDNVATKSLRKYLKDAEAEGVALGLFKKGDTFKNYQPMNTDAERILANWDEFRADVLGQQFHKGSRKDHNRSPEALAKLEGRLREYKNALENDVWPQFSNYLDRINASDSLSGRVLASKRVGSQQGNVDKGRFFKHLNQEFANKWSKDNNQGKSAFEALGKYGVEVAHRYAMAETIGVNGEKLNQAIAQANKDLSDAGHQTLSDHDINKFYDTVKAADNALGRIESKTARQIAQVAGATGTVATLPLVVLSSLTEIFNIAITTDMGTLGSAIANASANAGRDLTNAAFRRRPSEEHLSTKAQANAAQQTIAAIDNVHLARLGDPNISTRIAKGLNIYFKANLLSYWTQVLRGISSEAAKIQIDQDLATLKNYPTAGAGARAKARLNRLGIDDQKIKTLNNRSEFNSDDINQIYGDAIALFNTEVVLEPSWASKPLWMSQQNMWWLAQLTSYPTMFTNTILPKLAGKLNPKNGQLMDAMFIIGGISMLGAAQITAKDIVSGRDEAREPEELALEVFRRYMSAKPTVIVADILGLGGGYGDPATTVLAPTASKGLDLARDLGSAIKGELDVGKLLTDTLFSVTPAGPFKKHFE